MEKELPFNLTQIAQCANVTHHQDEEIVHVIKNVIALRELFKFLTNCTTPI